jgi:hypothetical protein
MHASGVFAFSGENPNQALYTDGFDRKEVVS